MFHFIFLPWIWLLFACIRAEGRVGFEVELPEFRIQYLGQPSQSVVAKTVLYQNPSGFWNLTADCIYEDYVYLELVTVPFELGSPHAGLEEFRKTINDLAQVVSLLKEKGHAAMFSNPKKKVFHISAPKYIPEDKFHLSYSPTDEQKKELLSPQVTFGILPDRFYDLTCHQFLHSTDVNVREWYGQFLTPGQQSLQQRICKKMEKLFDSEEFRALGDMSQNEHLKSFLTLFGQYLQLKSPYCLTFPKMVAIPFLSRTSFVDIFRNLPGSVRDAILQHQLFPATVRAIRDKFLDSNMRTALVFPCGYETQTGMQLEGPTIGQWVEGFTRSSGAIDLLAKLDEDKSMGAMGLDEVVCGSRGCEKLWIIENRGLPEIFAEHLSSTFETLFLHLSLINL